MYYYYAFNIFLLACINMIAVLGVSIFTGFTGLFSLGHAAFVGIGAYAAGALTYHWYVPFPLALLAGMLASGIASLTIGIPTLRAKLRSDYFAIAILGFGEALRVCLENLSITNGARGLSLDELSGPVWVVGVLIVSLVFARSLLKSRFGAMFVAIREDPVAAEMAGINLFRTRLLSLTVSAVMCGASGALLAHRLAFIQPVMFTMTQSTQLLASVIAGGMGSISGPVIVSFIFTALPEMLRKLEMYRLPAYGLMLVVIMIFRPQGLMGYREISDLLRGARDFLPGRRK
ncbi:MAG: branched-chain amino acid ABC transporter permease [Synergistaceae bacterium]|jgi:branched-chain amino acid transport system permease protein|nr:branched-chain amino acid ABC transporter permease [Synergistaceae bacterium]